MSSKAQADQMSHQSPSASGGKTQYWAQVVRFQGQSLYDSHTELSKLSLESIFFFKLPIYCFFEEYSEL